MSSKKRSNRPDLKGNEFWKQRATHGVKTIMENPQKLFEACIEYFQWCEDNPLEGEKVGFSKGKACKADTKHIRALTINGLTLFLLITPTTWYEWRKSREDLQPVISWAERVIYNQKFAGAAAGLLNANIISRELGLQEHTKEEHIIHADKPAIAMTPVDAYKEMLEIEHKEHEDG